MQKYQDVVLDRRGNVKAGASVLVSTLAGAQATIYSDDGVTETGNPLTTGSDGSFAFYAADGRYTLTISGQGLTTKTVSDIQLEDPQDVSGAVGDGVTDNLAAFAAALAGAAGGRLRIPAGTYRIPFSDSIALTIPAAGVTIEGDGKDCTTLIFVPATVAHKEAFSIPAALKLRGLAPCSLPCRAAASRPRIASSTATVPTSGPPSRGLPTGCTCL
jgi:hypothetical protein